MKFIMHKLLISCFLITALILLAEECFAKPLPAEFTVVATSPVPDPKKSDYPNCYYSILCSLPPPQKGEIILLIKCFENYKYTDTVVIKAGDKIRAEIIPFDELPEKEKSIQQSDTLERYDLDVFVASRIALIEKFSLSSDGLPDGSATTNANFEVRNFKKSPPFSPKIRESISKYIELELASVNRQISTRLWQDISPQYTEKADKMLKLWEQTRNSHDVLYWEGDSIIRVFLVKNLPSADNTKLIGDGIKVITEFDRELKKRNIRLICVSFPERWELYLPHYCTNVTDDQSFLMPRLLVMKKLLENGVEVIDLATEFRKQFRDHPYFSDIIANDSHPTDHGIEVLVDLLEKRLSYYDFSEFQYDRSFFRTKRVINLKKLSFPAGNDKFTGPYFVATYFDVIPKSMRRASPVFVIGDSFSITPWESNGSGLRGALGHRMKMIVDGYQNQGGATRIMRTISGRRYRCLEGKSVVIYAISPTAWDSNKWEPLVACDSTEDGNVIWDIENISDEMLKDLGAEKSGSAISLPAMDHVSGRDPGYYSKQFSVKIPKDYLVGDSDLFIDARVIAPRTKLIQKYGNHGNALISSPTGRESENDAIFFKVDKRAVKKSDGRLIFCFQSSYPQRIIITNLRVIAK